MTHQTGCQLSFLFSFAIRSLLYRPVIDQCEPVDAHDDHEDSDKPIRRISRSRSQRKDYECEVEDTERNRLPQCL